jgi:dTDP-4-dehydrorhamnose reductase
MRVTKKRMKILVFGKTGQVARELQRFEGVTALGRDDADLNDPAACAEIIAKTDADAVINAAAYTAVDKAETEIEEAFRVNAAAPTTMAQAAAIRGIPFLHISTDYVFDGSGCLAWKEDCNTAPLGVYGASKLAGEAGVRAVSESYVILRTSWAVSAHGSNFVKTILRLGAENTELSIVADQIGGPTPASDIASVMIEIAAQLIADSTKSGIYHFSGSPDVSWADFAREILQQNELLCKVRCIPSSSYPTVARRPTNSRLDCSKIKANFNISRPDWRIGLKHILNELKMNTSKAPSS